jgi:hypothetical protein
MRTIASLTAVALLATGLGVGSAQAEPGGCLKYGAAGAVGGHLMHHGVLGALGGCATGMWRRHEYRKGQRNMSRQNNQQGGYPQQYGRQQGDRQQYDQQQNGPQQYDRQQQGDRRQYDQQQGGGAPDGAGYAR